MWPDDLPGTAAACKGGDAAACVSLATSARRAWAESVVDASFDGGEIVGIEASTWLLAEACRLGSTLACRDTQRGAWERSPAQTTIFEQAETFTRPVTLVDPDGAPAIGREVRVLLGSSTSAIALVATDALGQVTVPTDARLEIAGWSTPVADRITLPGAARTSRVVRRKDDPWAGPDPVALLDGTWERQPNRLSERAIHASPAIHLELPGTTGGVAPSEPPPASMRFKVDASGEVQLNGDPAKLVPGDGVLRLDRGEHDAWIVPVEPDTFVFFDWRTARWSYAEVYRRR